MSDWEQPFLDERSPTRRDVGSFLEARDPSITNPWMRPRPPCGTNLDRLFEEELRLENGDCVENIHSPSHLRVFLRLKPGAPEQESLYTVKDNVEFVCHPLAENNPNTRNLRKTTEFYTFTHIFHKKDSQAAVFNKMIKDRLRKFIDGHNFTLMTYGASGSGKTYSLMGTDSQPGTIPRCLEFLFAQVSPSREPCHKPNDDNTLQTLTPVQQNKEISVIEAISRSEAVGPSLDALNSYRRMSTALTRASRAWHLHHRQDIHTEVWVSFAEIYQESAFDLLQEGGPPVRLRVVQPPNQSPYLKNLRWVCVRSGLEAYAVLTKGRHNIHYGQTNVNATSSRSHCIFSMKLVQINKEGDDMKATINTFRLCDLAGLERAKMTENKGTRLQESKKINSSLHVLERCLQALRGCQAGVGGRPPFRESKLTTLLQGPLSGQEAVAMLVTVNPQRKTWDETNHVLKFSALAKTIAVDDSKECALLMTRSYSDLSSCHTSPAAGWGPGRGRDVAELHREIQRLQEALLDMKKEMEQQETRVRTETAESFKKIVDQSRKDLLNQKARELKICENEHELVILRWESSLKELQNENAQLQHKLAIAEAKIAEQSPRIHNLSGIEPFREENDDSQEMVIDAGAGAALAEVPPPPTKQLPSPKDEPVIIPMHRYKMRDKCLPLVECYFTEKKQKPKEIIKGNSGSVRKELFSRHHLDMLAAEPLSWGLSPPQHGDRSLGSLKESPDPIRPPPLLKPYRLK